MEHLKKRNNYVTPRVGVWIETTNKLHYTLRCWSLPAWECGLKLYGTGANNNIGKSLPAWECGLKPTDARLLYIDIPVTPRVGVWIETTKKTEQNDNFAKSLPAWEGGLKQRSTYFKNASHRVTPRVGVWIETSTAVI